jgi:cephalosporin hydroxylase
VQQRTVGGQHGGDAVVRTQPRTVGTTRRLRAGYAGDRPNTSHTTDIVATVSIDITISPLNPNADNVSSVVHVTEISESPEIRSRLW